MKNTFLGVENKECIPCDFCFIGIKYCSAEYLRGVEKGADSIREISSRYANADGSSYPIKVYSPEEGYILKDTKIFDWGNVTASDLSELSKGLDEIKFKNDCVPIFVGGDHSVTYENVKKVAKEHDSVVIMQFDAHSDFIDEYKEYPHGSVMRETLKLEKISKIVHFGIRGNLNCEPALSESRQLGNIIVPYVKIKEMIGSVLEFLKDKEVYITFDTDFLNPICAPATNCPEPGGPSYEETLKYLKSIIKSSKRIIGIDFVEYNPKCEGSLVTGTTIVNLIMEALSYMKTK